MPDCRVTFVIPCFNHGRFIAAAVESCLRQRDAEVRVVIVDDGSDDGATRDACDALAGERVHVVHQANRGLPVARNVGIARARELGREWRAEYIAFLDADDYLEETFASELAAALAEAPADVSHAYCQERLVELGHGTWRVPEWDADLLLITNLHPVTCLLRWSAIDALEGARSGGIFDASMRLGYEDWDLWISFAGLGMRGVRVPRVLFNWRRHSNETMIFDAVRRHDELYGYMVGKHRGMYEPRMEMLLKRTNSMIRAWNMNWLDESGEPIPLQNLRRARDELARLREHQHGLGAELAATRARVERAERESLTRAAERDVALGEAARLRGAAARVTQGYERMGAVRLHHAAHRALAALPRAISGPLVAIGGGVVRVLARVLGGRRSGATAIAATGPKAAQRDDSRPAVQVERVERARVEEGRVP